jgi:hypothetical protein
MTWNRYGILPPTSPKVSPLMRFPNQNVYNISAKCPAHLILTDVKRVINYEAPGYVNFSARQFTRVKN